MSDTAPARIVTREEHRPCGCHVVEYSDKTGQVSPCVPCGMLDAARNLQGAAQALAATATRIRADQGRAAIAAATRAITPQG